MGEACTLMRNMRIEYSILLKNVKEGGYQEIPELDGKIVQKYILIIEICGHELNLSSLGEGEIVGFCEGFWFHKAQGIS